MNKRKSLITLASMLALPMLASVSVSAEDADCSITNTGPGSNNTCTVSSEFTCKVENDTVVIVNNKNEQVAQSGDATSGGNTTGGGATSGSATNSNGTTFNFTLTNEGCVVASVTQPKPTPNVPVGGSGAAGGGGAVVAEAAPRPTVLANTSGASTAMAAVAAVVAALTAAVASVRGYAFFQNRS